MRRAVWFDYVSFPLTPALCLGERIPRSISRIEPLNRTPPMSNEQWKI